ncbi:MAG: hypothetical protein BGO98_08425 [Myxococcales bacterium 68-20]|nr:MAG: hypothetical protein BGO98_08425 [Myxococcales bacterium 68-20]
MVVALLPPFVVAFAALPTDVPRRGAVDLVCATLSECLRGGADPALPANRSCGSTHASLMHARGGRDVRAQRS